VFAALNPKQFEAYFVRWMSGRCPTLAEQVVLQDTGQIHGMHLRHQVISAERRVEEELQSRDCRIEGNWGTP